LSKRQNIAGMSIGGGRKENFFFCLLEYFPESKRWFLSSVNQVKDEEDLDSDETIENWITKYDLKNLIVDFPMSRPVCDGCELKCPGTKNCNNPIVTDIRHRMEELLTEDAKRVSINPKRYEQERVEDNMVQHSRDIMSSPTKSHILSKSFKRKLKKGFIPYWNRPVDYWVWENYYDQLLNIFKVSYDSFSNVSMMLLSKFKYLLRHLPNELVMHESDVHLCILELYRAKIIAKKDVEKLKDIEEAVIGRLDIIRAIEKKLNIFIYENDLELIVKNPRAFDSFILTVVGERLLSGSLKKIPEWAHPEESRFVVPHF
jgi:hypothetical protein